MDSNHFKNILGTISTTIIEVIQQRISELETSSINTKDFSWTQSPVIFYHDKYRNLEKIMHDSILLADGYSLHFEEIKDTNDLIKILKYIEDYLESEKTKYISISWSILDFEERACQIEKREKSDIKLFDRSIFPFVLNELRKSHDSNYGITWDNIDEMLYEYCTLNS